MFVGPMDLRVATNDDAEAIRRIYNVYVETSTVTFDLVPGQRVVPQPLFVIRQEDGCRVIVHRREQ